MSSGSKVWFITGCSSGFGLAVTELALLKGDKVAATLRKPDVLADLATKGGDEGLLGRIDVVLSNAGHGIISEVEGTSEKNARNLFEVNFWGASYVCREAVRFFREENRPTGGRLIQVSSMSGVESSPGSAWYCASKFAIEGLTEALANEVSPSWNIKVTIVEPGPFRTALPATNMVTEPVHPAYSDPSLPSMQLRGMMSNPNIAFNGDPVKLAEAMYKLACLEDPPLRLPIHQVALEALRRRGRHLVDITDKWASWSEDICFKE